MIWALGNLPGAFLLGEGADLIPAGFFGLWRPHFVPLHITCAGYVVSFLLMFLIIPKNMKRIHH